MSKLFWDDGDVCFLKLIKLFTLRLVHLFINHTLTKHEKTKKELEARGIWRGGRGRKVGKFFRASTHLSLFSHFS